MKNLFKILLVFLILSFASCTDNEEIVSENEVTNNINIYGIDKEDSTNINNEGDDDEEFWD